MKYTVPSLWRGETCVIIAGGPSLKTNPPDLRLFAGTNNIRKVRVITINDSWRLFPHADVLYFGDQQWWTRQIAANPRSLYTGLYLGSFHDMIYKGFWITGAPGFGDHPQVRSLRITGERGLEDAPDGLRHGSNSGYAAINLAAHFGVERIVLLGYDMKVVNGRTHWHDSGIESAESYKTLTEKDFLPHFESLVDPLRQRGIEVINATPNSALTCFFQASLEEALNSVNDLKTERRKYA